MQTNRMDEPTENIKGRTCPECGSTKILTDPRQGERFCQRCGCVITDRAVTRGPEWRAFDAKGRTRNSVKPGAEILIIMKNDQRTGNLTRGTVKDILTNSPTHPHGIKVRL